ncbi:MAG TPA: hypothetical protein VEC14_05760, partial [Reyranellaceae bacterium]|nr:hypothetical protein [Reyranellaceae bacterium]
MTLQPASSSSVVLFGAGSPILADVEETCLRLGISVAAIVRNTDDAVPDGVAATILPDQLSPALLAMPMAFPLFTPA